MTEKLRHGPNRASFRDKVRRARERRKKIKATAHAIRAAQAQLFDVLEECDAEGSL